MKQATELYCETCAGTGWAEYARLGANNPDVYEAECDMCDGSGAVFCEMGYHPTQKLAVEMIEDTPCCAECARLVLIEIADDANFRAFCPAFPLMMEIGEYVESLSD